jgi:adenylate cyclase
LDTRRRAANLARFQSPRLIETVASRTHPLSGGTSQEAVVVFVDIAGFTTLAEGRTPAETARFLRGFHELVEDAAEPLGGTIMDFAGDGVLVAFGLPRPARDDADRALQFIDRVFETAAHRDLVLRATGHAGQVQLSLLGGLRHRTLSISGDVVNTASRLQDAAKRLDAAIAVSGALVAAAGDGRAHGLEPAGETLLRGRTAPVPVWIRPGETPARRRA